MKQVFAYIFQGIGIVAGALACGALMLMVLAIRDGNDQWFWVMVVSMVLALVCVIAVAVGITLHEPVQRMRSVPHPIAVGRSGAPEMTDPMPSPARVRRPVSEAYRAQERTLSEGE